jgi:hypothetical protein
LSSPRQKSGNHRAWGRIASLLEGDFHDAGAAEGLREIGLSAVEAAGVVTDRVLRKKPFGKSMLRDLYRDYGAGLKDHVKLERCSRASALDEEAFVRFYPYLPHLIELSIGISAGIRKHREQPPGGQGNLLGLVQQACAMLVSERTRFLDQAVGSLVTMDRLYDILQETLPLEKQQRIVEIERTLDRDDQYHAMASRVAKVVCLMGFVPQDVPATPKNIAALLVQDVDSAPPLAAVESSLYHLKQAHFAYDTEDGCWQLAGLDDARHAASDLEWLRQRVGMANARPPGLHNDAIQALKRLLARSLSWYTRPLQDFQAAVTRSVQGAVRAADYLSTSKAFSQDLVQTAASVEQLSMDVVALRTRLAESEKRGEEVRESLERRIELLERQLGTPRVAVAPANGRGHERTTYILGLFGTGRRYLNHVLEENLGDRSRYFRDAIRVHPGPTPMIYSGHATIKYPSRDQAPPEVMREISSAIRSRFARSIFVFRHPLDSLLTNWVWWRAYLRDNEWVSGIRQVYKDSGELCAALEENFSEFLGFAQGDPVFFASQPGPRFLSFPEFVEETELHLKEATLALRFEDFIADPRREISKVLELLSLEDELDRWNVPPPNTQAYGYRAVRDQVPCFQKFIDGLDRETKQRIERMGYSLD